MVDRSRILKRRILLPQELDNQLEGRLQKLVQLREETNGVLLYLPVPKSDYIDCRVDSLYMTGVGTSGHVRADQTRMDIINKFFEMHPEYRFIKWHTHSRGTGRGWYQQLSEGDLNSYKEQLKIDLEFIGMMVSPTGKIIIAQGEGRKDTTLRVVATWSDFYETERYIHDEILHAAKSLGYSDIPRLIARR